MAWRERLSSRIWARVNVHDRRCADYRRGGFGSGSVAMKRTKPIPKRRSKARRGPLRAPGYLDWLRKNYCLLCQHMGLCQFNETEAAHTGPHGTSQKAADNQALPLCGRCHREARYSLHVLGRAFWNNFHLDREALVEDYWRRWVNTVASEKELAALR
jgi:hypothetical protein